MSFPRSLRGHWYVRSPVLMVTACKPLGRCLVLVVTGKNYTTGGVASFTAWDGIGIRYGVQFPTILGSWLVILGGMVATIRGDPGDSLRVPVLVVTVCVGSPSQLPLGVHNCIIDAK
ncbi:unnamed protein product [Rhizophagus irregularis]|nr:unnamed protein product [Rhizophagus irregularis]